MTTAKTVALLAVLSLAGCAGTHGCFIGVSLIPPSPVLMCGIDVEPKDDVREAD